MPCAIPQNCLLLLPQMGRFALLHARSHVRISLHLPDCSAAGYVPKGAPNHAPPPRRPFPSWYGTYTCMRRRKNTRSGRRDTDTVALTLSIAGQSKESLSSVKVICQDILQRIRNFTCLDRLQAESDTVGARRGGPLPPSLPLGLNVQDQLSSPYRPPR